MFSTPVDREDILGLVGVYVDDTLVTGPKNICEGVVKALHKLWKTGDPEFLTPSTPFRFLGVQGGIDEAWAVPASAFLC